MSANVRRLMRPDLLSESVLLEILKTRCIEAPKSVKKSDLIELFRRIALPLPQRRYNVARHLGKRLHQLRVERKISIATDEEQTSDEKAVSSQNISIAKPTTVNVRPTNEDYKNSLPKKFQVPNATTPTNRSQENGGLKRKNNDTKVSAQTGVKKQRQAIQWP